MTAAASGLLIALSLAADAPADALRLTPECEVRFATAEQGRQILTTDDAFTAQLSRFDLQCRLKTDKDVTLADWKHFVAEHVRAWQPTDISLVSNSVERLKKRLAAFRLPLPPIIHVVRTTGDEEANAAYTRSATIVLPAKVIDYDETKLDRLLLHELFHIISRHDGAMRAKLYAIIGFEICEPIELPPSLAPRRITNPDAPLINCTMTLTAKSGKKVIGAPVLYAATKQYDAQKAATLFQSLLFRLLVVEQRGDRWQPVLVKGEPVVINPREEPEFLDKIGKNTNYIIHPDEILADNFVRLVMNDENIPSPQIIDQMRRVLTRQ
ncbi:MAG TPA: hypothetical protein VGI40_04500 [Pirellulaceae bacterium]|jgi:hypothetical protein